MYIQDDDDIAEDERDDLDESLCDCGVIADEEEESSNRCKCCGKRIY